MLKSLQTLRGSAMAACRYSVSASFSQTAALTNKKLSSLFIAHQNKPSICQCFSIHRPLVHGVRMQHSKSSPRVVRTISEYRQLRQEWFKQGALVGFVPTMGALHSGHASLAKEARIVCDQVVASVFVNPAQFAPTEDLDKYPRTEKDDIALLAAEGVDVVFAPSVTEMYPAGISLNVKEQVGTFVHVMGKSHQMEGSIRPHFFRGVATVVSKLFNIIQPTHAFFGQKDIQQCSVVRTMVRDLMFPTEIVVVPTVREHDGLAKSSRNRYLSQNERAIAPVLYQALFAASKEYELGERSRNKLLAAAESVIAQTPAVKLEYISLVEPIGLEEVDTVEQGAILSGAIRVGNTRIIDNILLGMSLYNI
ncbi:pantoate-beta-alanine ligase [Batrachochytrium dendrobatidis]